MSACRPPYVISFHSYVIYINRCKNAVLSRKRSKAVTLQSAKLIIFFKTNLFLSNYFTSMLFFCYNILHFLIFSPEKQYVFQSKRHRKLHFVMTCAYYRFSVFPLTLFYSFGHRSAVVEKLIGLQSGEVDLCRLYAAVSQCLCDVVDVDASPVCYRRPCVACDV